MDLAALAQLASTQPSGRRPLNAGAAELPLQAALVSSGRPAPPEAVVGVGSEPPCLLALAELGGCSAARHDPVTPRHARQRRWSWEVAPQTEHVGALISLASEGVGALVSLALEGQAITPTKGYDGTSARTARRRAMEARGFPLDKERVCEDMRRCKRSRRDTDAPLANPAVQPRGVAERASCPWVLQQALGTKLADYDRDARACKAIVAGAVCSHQRDQIASQCGQHGDWLVWPPVCRVEQTWFVFLFALVGLIGERRESALTHCYPHG